MRRLLLVLTLAAGCGRPAPPPPPPPSYAFDALAAWSSFAEGSHVEVDVERSGLTMRVVKTLAKKSPEAVTLRVETRLKIGDTEEAKTSVEEIRPGRDEGPWGDDTVPVDGRAFKCRVRDRDGTKTWYCPDVPGHVVRQETAASRIRLVRFETK
jgi:hypothetical protein